MKKYSFYFVSVLFCITLNAENFFTTSMQPIEQIGQTPSLLDTHDIIQTFLQPVQFTRQGISTFFSSIFNSSLYCDRFLGSCFIHVIDFLDHGKKNNKPYTYYESVFNLFHHRLKENTWTNPYAALLFVEQIPVYLENLQQSQDGQLAQALKTELEKNLNEKAFLLKDRPEQFYTEITENVLSTVKAFEQQGSLRDVQRSLTLFIESMYSKLIWNPNEKEDIWKSIKLIAQQTEQLYMLGYLANTDELNRILWSMLYRFGYFIECAGSSLSPEFYQDIRDDLVKETPSFLTYEESEEWLTIKKNYLESVLLKGDIKAQAYKQGIMADVRL